MARVFPSSSPLLLAAVLAAAVSSAEAQYGLRSSESRERVSREFVAQQLFGELTALLGHGESRERLARFERRMQASYAGLPKNKYGGIDQAVARYALHRYFLMHRGWHIQGLAPDGERWNASSSTEMLKSKMPSFILELLEESVGRRHIGLQELAVLAATVEDLVHGDTIELLRMAYRTHGFSESLPLVNGEQEQIVLKTYLLYFLMPRWQANSSAAIIKLLPDAHKEYPGWDDTWLWLEDLQESIKDSNREHNPFANAEKSFRDFASMSKLVEKFIDGIGTFQNIECKMMKNLLLDLDPERSDGRVLLTRFWGPRSRNEHAWFPENPPYLMNQGALDYADHSRVSVIVPNVIYSRSNCMAVSSSFHSVCCVDQCGALMETLERSIAHPVAAPGVIAELVAGLHSDTIAAPRNLSGSLRRKLDMIAAQHGGHVPLHGRMFAMWMHHAFPNECPLPQAPGAAAPLTRDEYNERFGSPFATKKQMEIAKKITVVDPVDPHELSEAAMLWSEEEELLTDFDPETLGGPRPEAHGQARVLRSLLHFLAIATAGCAAIAFFWDSLRSAVGGVGSAKRGRDGLGLPSWIGEGGLSSSSGATRSRFV